MAKIYLSATYKDLKPHRDAVYRILRRLRHDIISMEDYVASDAYPLHKCLADVAGCDVYVGLAGWRYGYVPDKENPKQQSITELEYRKAGDAGLPRLLFLANPTAAWPDEFKDSHTGEGKGGQWIAAFRAELETERLVSYFRTPDHLAGLVSVAVQQCRENASKQARIKRHFRTLLTKTKSRGFLVVADKQFYIQFDFYPAIESDELTCETVSNSKLPKRSKLNESQVLQLKQLGFKQPDADSNFVRVLQLEGNVDRDVQIISSLTWEVLTHIYGCTARTCPEFTMDYC
jgi:hypothetical protein